MSIKHETTSVSLPCGPEDFRDFIKSLLGKPQSITNRFTGSFDLNRQDLEQFHYLLADRLKQQNKVQLVMFTARVLYDDDSSVQVNDFEAFTTYNEIKPLVSKAVHLSWEFLVTFEDREAPEKQQVEISFITDGPFHIIDRIEGPFPIGLHAESFGSIGYRINHTARTWASDIDAMLSAHIKNILPNVPPWRKWISTHSAHISIFTILILLLSSVVTLLRVGDSFWIKSRDTLNRTVEAQTDVGQKLHVIAQEISSGTADRFMARSVAYLVIALIVSIAVGVWAGIASEARRPAFLCLTRKSEEAKAKAIQKTRHRFLNFCLSIVVAIICGVLGNYLFALYVQLWSAGSQLPPR